MNAYCFNIFLTQVSAFVIYNSLFYNSFQVVLHIGFRRMPASMLGFLVILVSVSNNL